MWKIQIRTTTVAHRSLDKAIDLALKNTVEDVNGTPDFILVGITSKYQKKDYKRAIHRIKESSGIETIIGGTFPTVVTNNELPTTQGCSIFVIKCKDIKFEKPFSCSNIRVNQKKGIEEIAKKYRKNKRRSKLALTLVAGTTLQANAIEQLKVLDLKMAKEMKKMFNFLGGLMEKKLAKEGYGTVGYIDTLVEDLAKKNISNLIGGATFDIDLESSYQFCGDKITVNGLTGTLLSSDKIHFGHSWTFDKSIGSESYTVSDYLQSGYIQTIHGKLANEELLNVINIPRELYNQSFESFSYANPLYLSGLKSDDNEYFPFLTLCHPTLKGVVTTFPKSKAKGKEFRAEIFKQSGIGVARSAGLCTQEALVDIEKPHFGIFINCANRLLIAGDKIVAENKKIESVLGEDIPFITLYSGAEFSAINKKPIYTNAAIHCIVAGEKKEDSRYKKFEVNKRDDINWYYSKYRKNY